MLHATINFAMEEVHNEPKPETDKPMSSPVMDVMPPSGSATDNRPNVQPTDHLPKQPTTHQTEIKLKALIEQKQPSKGVGMAITATVIIVIAMAVLATYAYLKTAR